MYDVHAHLSFRPLIDKIDEIIENCRSNGIKKIIEIGCHRHSCVTAKTLSNDYEEVFYTIGIHPNDAMDFDEVFIENFFIHKDKKLVGVGETGLDFFESLADKQTQIKVFEKHIELASKYNLPLILHNRDAGIEILDILKANKYSGKALFHCYTGDWDVAKKILDNGYSISFTGIVTYPKKTDHIKEVVQKIPIDSFMIETDCPYLAPQSIRGQINTPVSVIEIARYIADLRNDTFENIQYITSKNADLFFNF